MKAQREHGVPPRPNADERGREGFLTAMWRYLITNLYNGNATAYRDRQVPAFER